MYNYCISIPVQKCTLVSKLLCHPYFNYDVSIFNTLSKHCFNTDTLMGHKHCFLNISRKTGLEKA